MEAIVMGEKRRLSRRTLLRSGVIAGTAFLAGCAGTSDESEGGPTTSPPADALFQEISFEGTDLVVQLREDHEVTGLNLIAPDGSTFAQENVPAGATKVILEILNLTTGKHYTPGAHDLIAVSNGEKLASRAINLSTGLEIVDVRQYSESRPTPSNRGNVIVTIENNGSGPTWVYSIAYEGAPFERANKLIDSSEYPTNNLILPKTAEETILLPGESQDYMGDVPPFIISNSESCDGRSIETTVIAQAAVGKSVRRTIRATLSGERLSANFRDACGDVSVEFVGDENRNE